MMWVQKGLAKMMIMVTTKEYMAVDSIIASPTNKVLVIVGAASGCSAIALKADATERPSLSAGNIHPSDVVSPAVMIETMAMVVMLSILLFFIG
jgi:Ca2+/Na+ antiporter